LYISIVGWVMRRIKFMALVTLLVCTQLPAKADTNQRATESYSKKEVMVTAEGLFGSTTAGLAKAIERAFSDLGEPNAFIEGQEFSAAMMIGLRYGEGTLNTKNAPPKKVYWQGPSVGYDFGGQISKVLTLVYNLKDPDAIYRRFSGVDGSLYFFAGVSLNYQSVGTITLVPIRTGLGMRMGANVGYLHYNKEHSWLPF
jgi:hypothetical protein